MTATKRRWGHISFGLILFATGLFMSFLYQAQVLEFIRGAAQPATILLGLIALCAAVLGRKEFRSFNAILSGLLLFVGIYGLYDEYYAVQNVFMGILPLALTFCGCCAFCHGLRLRRKENAP